MKMQLKLRGVLHLGFLGKVGILSQAKANFVQVFPVGQEVASPARGATILAQVIFSVT